MTAECVGNALSAAEMLHLPARHHTELALVHVFWLHDFCAMPVHGAFPAAFRGEKRRSGRIGGHAVDLGDCLTRLVSRTARRVPGLEIVYDLVTDDSLPVDGADSVASATR